ncbi:60S ribosomal export protein NMD3 [Iris pallida]|uniref:60S ribosomal export protein NMD3 n=1 Tax=Iris pallida TaxID=29817 RepID=A0AAX6GT57_IRIPA|nr:60S ribosomal export protein NMD3 [Iris pallida]
MADLLIRSYHLSSSGMFLPIHTQGTIPCPTCSTPILPSSVNQCPRCLSARADLTSPLPRHLSLYCPECISYLQPPKTYLRADPESKQLLSICLSRVKKPLSSNRLKLIHADFVWTEPHSKRIKLRLRVQGELDRNTIVEQTHVAEFQVVDHLCDSCSRAKPTPTSGSPRSSSASTSPTAAHSSTSSSSSSSIAPPTGPSVSRRPATASTSASPTATTPSSSSTSSPASSPPATAPTSASSPTTTRTAPTTTSTPSPSRSAPSAARTSSASRPPSPARSGTSARSSCAPR